jgi:hypothetical protein
MCKDALPEHLPKKNSAVAAFAGLGKIKNIKYAIFLINAPNQARRAGEQEALPQAFAAPLSQDYFNSKKKLSPGVPYRFSYSDEKSDGTEIKWVTSQLADILPASDELSPELRGLFIGGGGGQVLFKLTELPTGVVFEADPQIEIFLDQVELLPHFHFAGDFLLKTRASMNKYNKHIACVGSLVSTVHRGSTNLVRIRDVPSFDFVGDLCVKTDAHMILGGDDYDERLPVPVIPNQCLVR